MLTSMHKGNPEFPYVFQTCEGSFFRTWAFITHQILHQRPPPIRLSEFMKLPLSLD